MEAKIMRELDIMLGLSDQEWSVPFGDEPSVAEKQEEVSRVYVRAPLTVHHRVIAQLKKWLLLLIAAI
jgi:hypothetical protein